MPSAQDLLEAAAPHLARLDALDARTQEGAMQTLLDMAIAHAGPSATSPKAGTSKGGAKETIDAKHGTSEAVAVKIAEYSRKQNRQGERQRNR